MNRRPLRYLTLLNLTALFVLLAAVRLIITNSNDPSTKGWAYMYATFMAVVALIIFVADRIFARYFFKSNPLFFWIAEVLLFSILLFEFVTVGLPAGKL
jgi:hypothetical protein